MQTAPVVQFDSPLLVTAGVQSNLCNQIVAGDLPYQGVWLNALWSKQHSIEVAGTFSTLSLQVYGTNNTQAANSYLLTIGGSFTNNDVVNLSFFNLFLAGGVEVVSTTVVGGDTSTTLAARVAAAINADQKLGTQGITAIAIAGAVSVTWPTGNPTQSSSGPDRIMQNSLYISAAVTGAATETVVVTGNSGGVALGAAVTAAGLTQLAATFRYVNVRVTTLTGAGAFVNAYYQGTN